MSIILALLLPTILFTLSKGQSFDDTTFRQCNREGDEPQVGQAICYERSFDGLDCTETPIRSEELDSLSSLFKVGTPNFLPNIPSYEAQQLCIFNLPSCPENELTHLQWENGNFELRPASAVFQGSDFRLCPDRVRVNEVQLNSFGGLNPDSRGNFCGMQPGFSLRFQSRNLRVEFFSGNTDTDGQFRGFLMDIMCTDTNFEPIEVGDDNPGRFRRDTNEEFYIHIRGKRFALQPADMTTDNCTVIRGDRDETSPTTTPNITTLEPVKRIGNNLQIPNAAFLSYDRRILKVIQNGVVQETFFNIRRLFFWTGFNGTRVFTDRAPVPLIEIFGGGTLRFVADCAYYVTFNSPPIYEPTSMELEIIGFLLNETNPFFVDRLFPLPTTAPPPTMPPPPKKGHYRGRRYSFPQKAGLAHKIMKRWAHHHYYPSPTPPPPPVVDPTSVQLATRFINACNPFLRQASRSFLAIVRGAT